MSTSLKTGGLQQKYIELLYNISRILDTDVDMKNIFKPVLESLANQFGLDACTLTLLNRTTGEILTEATYGLSASEASLLRYRVGEGVTGKVFETGESQIIPATHLHPQFLNKSTKGKARQTSFICVPIKIGKTAAGALSIELPIAAEVDLVEIEQMLSIVASMIAHVVKLRQQTQESRQQLENENERLKQELAERFRPSNIIGNSHEMKGVYARIAQVSKTPTTVLIQGETGTGKELVAHAIHYNSNRANKPFVKVHCAALPESIIESELFGHEKGAFTSAVSRRIGRFEMAHGGTLFLDEIGEISVPLQIKLLRVIQEREFERVGGTQTVKVNVRLIAATNRNLSDMVQAGDFREDLFYRLNVFPVYVPPLRKRKADIVLLADFFIEKYNKEMSKRVARLSSHAIDMLMAYHWPGNVRELENCMEHAVLTAESEVIHGHNLPPTLQTSDGRDIGRSGTLQEMVEAYEADIIRDALKSARGNMAQAARDLGTTKRIIGYKVHNYGISPKQYL